MSISTGSGGASGMGASSSSSDASAMDLLERALARSVSRTTRHWRAARLTARAAQSAEDWSRHAFFMAKPSRQDVLSTFTTRSDAIGAHQPAQLDEEPVRVGVLLLFHAPGGLLEAQAHATQELLHPGEKAQKIKKSQTVKSLSFLETNLSHDGLHRSSSKVISASQ